MNIRRGSAATLTALLLTLATVTSVLAASTTSPWYAGYEGRWSTGAITAAETRYTVPVLSATSCTTNAYFSPAVTIGPASPAQGEGNISLEGGMIAKAGSYRFLASGTSKTSAFFNLSMPLLYVAPGDTIRLHVKYAASTRRADFTADNLTRKTSVKAYKILSDTGFYDGTRMSAGLNAMGDMLPSFGSAQFGNTIAWYGSAYKAIGSSALTAITMTAADSRPLMTPGLISSGTSFKITQQACK